MHFSISVFDTPGRHTDAALSCYFALTALGWKCCVRRNAVTKGTTNIVFGAYALPVRALLPPSSIIYNFETPSSPFFNDGYVKRLQKAASVWDFSEQNSRAVAQRTGVETTYVFPGYVPEMSCLAPGNASGSANAIDLLFYGTKTERRAQLWEKIQGAGLEPVWHEGYDVERDCAIAQANIVLNVHAVHAAPLEIPRLGFLWANEKAVLCEDCPRTGIPAGLEDACVYAPYDELPEMAMKMHKSPSLRRGIAHRGFKAYTAKPLAGILESIVGRPASVVPDQILPTTLHVGAGNDFLPHCLNVDINPNRHPDLLVDLSQPLDSAQVFHTRRFGDISLAPESFSRIIVLHVLEHIRDLTQMMTNFITLLEIGGELEIAVPYELSCGAWQDPTHVRALNEKSWLYYCGGHAYLDWRDFCFELQALEFELSDYGRELEQKGVAQKDILRTPRAVSAQKVLLRKRATTDEEKAEYDKKLRTVYKEETPAWRI